LSYTYGLLVLPIAKNRSLACEKPISTPTTNMTSPKGKTFASMLAGA